MTTLKEYKEMMETLPLTKETDWLDLECLVFELDEARRELCPELIRVIELAEDILNKCVAHTSHTEKVLKVECEQALSEIRKLKGE